MRTHHAYNFDEGKDFTDVRAMATTSKIGVIIEDDRTLRHSDDRHYSEKLFWMERKTAKRLYKSLKKALKES